MPRVLLINLMIVPLALVVGYMLATPTDYDSFLFLLLALGVLVTPILLRSHHFLLAFSWNAALIVFFLPGQPQLGTALAFISLGIAVITRSMSKQKEFIRVPSLTVPLVLLLGIVVITAHFTGGIGARVLGAETWGAKRYISVFGAIVGYFALTSQVVPRDKAFLYFAVFFLGGLTTAMSDFIYMAGPTFYILFTIFPSTYASSQAFSMDLMRLSGISFACAWGYYYLIGRFGVEGLFNVRAPWRLILLGVGLAGSLLGGYRGLTILLLLVFACQFWFERVYRKTIGPVLILGLLLILVATTAFIDLMPLSVQRAFSFLPMERIDPRARMDALSTLDWRLNMWKVLIPEIPKYLLVGKGYGFSGSDYYLTQEAVKRGMLSQWEDTLVNGNYHNGILTLLIPFGIWGFGAFSWFIGSSLVVLVRNFRYGRPDLQVINTFLLGYFVARLLFYIVFYGQFDSDLAQFTGIIGLSVSLNGGVSLPQTEPAAVLEETQVPAPRLVMAN